MPWRGPNPAPLSPPLLPLRGCRIGGNTGVWGTGPLTSVKFKGMGCLYPPCGLCVWGGSGLPPPPRLGTRRSTSLHPLNHPHFGGIGSCQPESPYQTRALFFPETVEAHCARTAVREGTLPRLRRNVLFAQRIPRQGTVNRIIPWATTRTASNLS